MLYPYGVPDYWAFRQAIFVQKETNQTMCDSLQILNCSTKTNEELINALLVPAVRDLVHQSLTPVAIYTRLTYKCRMGFRDEPKITYQLGGSTVSTCAGRRAVYACPPRQRGAHTGYSVDALASQGQCHCHLAPPYSLLLALCRGLT